MRILHIPHFHSPDWEHIRQRARELIHDPLFWSILILALIIIAIMFLATLVGPVLPETQPYAPTYPYMG